MGIDNVIAVVIGLLVGVVITYPLMAARLQHAKENLSLIKENQDNALERIKESVLTWVSYPYNEDDV